MGYNDTVHHEHQIWWIVHPKTEESQEVETTNVTFLWTLLLVTFLATSCFPPFRVGEDQ